jgi:hypothetical protein
MARFSDLLKGKRARRTVEFPQANTRSSLLAPLPEQEAQRAADKTTDEPAVMVDLVVLNADEEARALEEARAMAIKAGVTDPKLGEPLYDLALMVFSLLYGCLVHGEDTCFFESADQIRKGLDRDRITYIYAQHELWQNECSPQAKSIDDAQFFSFIVEMAGSEDPSRPFAKLQPATLAIYTRIMARLLLNSPTLKSEPLSTSEASSETSTSSPPDDQLQ